MHDFFVNIHFKRKQKKNVFPTVLMIFNSMTFANFEMQKFENANIVKTTNDAKNEKRNQIE